MTVHDPHALRASLDARLANHAREIGYDVNRLRRHLVFQRVLARLAPSDRWVLKGGFALEVRLPARATKDLDLTMLGLASELHDEFAEALAVDVAADGFEFEIRRAREIAPDDDQNDAVRFSVRARLGGREFASVVIDAVARPDELATAVGPIVVPPPVLAPGIEPITIPAVDVAQHAAERFHALARRYSDDRPSTRVKDLVDLVLMLDTRCCPTIAWVNGCVRCTRRGTRGPCRRGCRIHRRPGESAMRRWRPSSASDRPSWTTRSPGFDDCTTTRCGLRPVRVSVPWITVSGHECGQLADGHPDLVRHGGRQLRGPAA